MNRLTSFFKKVFPSKETRQRAAKIKEFHAAMEAKGIKPGVAPRMSVKDALKARFRINRTPKKIKSSRKSRLKSKLSVQFGTYSALKPINLGGGRFEVVRPAYRARIQKLQRRIHVAVPGSQTV